MLKDFINWFLISAAALVQSGSFPFLDELGFMALGVLPQTLQN